MLPMMVLGELLEIWATAQVLFLHAVAVWQATLFETQTFSILLLNSRYLQIFTSLGGSVV